MISVEEAKRIMMERVWTTMPYDVSPDQAAGFILTRDMRAPFGFPLFDMSAVDGYAICGAGPEWRLAGNVAAGDVLGRFLHPGECVRIFTGAHVPMGSSAVAMQEKCRVEDGVLRIEGAVPGAGSNIRKRAEGWKEGDVLLHGGAMADAPSVGMIAAAGISDVTIHASPSVNIVRTGNEFFDDGEELMPGRIFSSNEWMLSAALRKENIFIDDGAFVAGDTEKDLIDALNDANNTSDVIITTGGVSVGDHDLVADVLKKLGATIHFHGVAQKPGKPMLFAVWDKTIVFGLPGNPRAVMVLFWEYVLPFLRAMQGAKDPWLKTDHVPLSHAVNVKGDRAEFRAAQVKGGKVTLLADEGSHMLRSLVDADALAYIPANVRALREGDPIEVHFLP